MARKKRQLREREQLILEVSNDLLLELGYHGLTMDRVAEAAEYSKGTIYQHFGCKEEIISALARHHLQIQQEMVERAATFEGRTRERMMAVGEAMELFMKLHPREVRMLQIINSEAISSKASEDFQNPMKEIEFHALEVVSSIIRDAVGCGDMQLPPDTSPEEVTFGLWSVVSGGNATALRKLPLHEINIADPHDAIIKACHLLADGCGWRPLWSEWDYEATRRRVRWELFEDEAKLIYGQENASKQEVEPIAP